VRIILLSDNCRIGQGEEASMAFTIEFQPLGLRLKANEPLNALDAARQAGIQITAVCGGDGTCGKCVIQILESKTTHPVTAADQRHLSAAQLEAGFRLACTATFSDDIRIYVPASSILEDQIMQTEGSATGETVLPAFTQTPIALDSAHLNDLASDLSRIKLKAGDPALQADLEVMRLIPSILRENGWNINLIRRDHQLMHVTRELIEAPLGLAVDVGSTKIACYLIDLSSGKTLTAHGTPNPQIAYGEDIMARLSFAMQGTQNAEQLHNLTMQAINEAAGEMCHRIGQKPEEIMDLCLVGNTAMHHFFLDLPTASLAVSPFVPAVTDPLYPSAKSLGLVAMPGAAVYAPPVKAGFIGSDHLAFLYASQFSTDKRVRLGIDIGTNTEIALQSGGKIVSVSTASGPAFEGAHIAYGMRAAPGAIEHVRIQDDGSAAIDVIGGQDPIGICGSGILDAVAQMRSHGILNKRGRFEKESGSIKADMHGKPVYFLSAGDKPVTLSQQDIDQILLAKGAIRAGIDILMDYLQVKAEEIEEIVIAGAFGSYMLPEHAMGIGMLPTIPLEHIKVVGNAAGAGARLMLMNTDARREAETLAEQIEYLELTVYPEFSIFYAKGIQA
jgi:uncharacterized 2Fe-2S/4Fe-4S cluster protein (DUF4445 family)